MNKEIEHIFVKLLKDYLDLPDNYGTDEYGNEIPTVFIKAQNIKLFNTTKMQITISCIGNTVFANRCEHFEKIIDNQLTYMERVCVNEQRQMQIDVYSRNNEARERFWEVQAALTSTAAQELQDQYQFRIGKISNATNISGLDGGSDINRFTIRFNCLSWQTKEKPVKYYDWFNTQARTEKGKFADFTITLDENNEQILIDNMQDN